MPFSRFLAAFTTGAGMCIPALPQAAIAAQFQAVVTHVSDGDTVWVRRLRGDRPEPVRIVGIDAPEICQAFGPEAKQALAERVLQRRVVVHTSARDGHERLVGSIWLGKEDVGQWMVAHGYAWSYRFRGSSGPYRDDEAAARAAGVGLWRSPSPQMPREFRALHGSCQMRPAWSGG
jgi:endonuclease YncB( thermonuclease family)